MTKKSKPKGEDACVGLRGSKKGKVNREKIRNSEYYDMEGTFDRLYAESKKDKNLQPSDGNHRE